MTYVDAMDDVVQVGDPSQAQRAGVRMLLPRQSRGFTSWMRTWCTRRHPPLSLASI